MSKTIAPELVAALRRLRLGRMVDTLPDRIALAEAESMAFEDLLSLVLTDEIVLPTPTGPRMTTCRCACRNRGEHSSAKSFRSKVIFALLSKRSMHMSGSSFAVATR